MHARIFSSCCCGPGRQQCESFISDVRQASEVSDGTPMRECTAACANLQLRDMYVYSCCTCTARSLAVCSRLRQRLQDWLTLSYFHHEHTSSSLSVDHTCTHPHPPTQSLSHSICLSLSLINVVLAVVRASQSDTGSSVHRLRCGCAARTEW